MKHTLAALLAVFSINASYAQTKFFEGTWKEAFEEAQRQNKYLFIDCYTDWCVWCKVADEKTFPTDAVSNVLNENFISVKVDMERGDGVALGVRYRVMGYPSYLMFTPKGKLAGKMFGFEADANLFAENVKSVLDEANQANYPSLILDQVDFPGFYINSFTNKDKGEKRQNPEDGMVEKWLSTQKDMMSEEAWSVLYKFPIPEKYLESFLNNRIAYAKKFGYAEVEEKISGIAFTMLQKAIKSEDEKQLLDVLDFADKYVESDVDKRKSLYKLMFCEGRGDWTGYVECVKGLIDLYGFENFLSEVNNYSWTIYLNADNPEVVKTAIGWMSKVVELDSQYMYLDTYAALLFKSGDAESALVWAEKAIAVGTAAGENVKETEDLRGKILQAKGAK